MSINSRKYRLFKSSGFFPDLKDAFNNIRISLGVLLMYAKNSSWFTISSNGATSVSMMRAFLQNRVISRIFLDKQISHLLSPIYRPLFVTTIMPKIAPAIPPKNVKINWSGASE